MAPHNDLGSVPSPFIFLKKSLCRSGVSFLNVCCIHHEACGLYGEAFTYEFLSFPFLAVGVLRCTVSLSQSS